MPGKKSQTQPTLKWDTYKIGSIRTPVIRELNLIVQEKEYRQKKGLESGGLKDVKGNPHWQLYATIELFEMLSKRIDDIQKFSFFRTYQQLNTSINRLDQLSIQLQNTGNNLNANVTQSQNSLANILAKESESLKLIQQNLNDGHSSLKNQNDELKSDIKKIIKILKTALTSEMSAFTEKISTNINLMVDKIETNGNELKENISVLKDFLVTESSELKEEADKYLVSFTSKMNENNSRLIEELNNLRSLISTTLNDNMQKIEIQFNDQNTSFTNLINDKIQTHQETVNNIFKDQHKLIVTKINQTSETSSKQMIDLLQNITLNSEENTNKLSQHIDELNEGRIGQIDEVKTSLDKKLTQEIEDLRTVLSNIRTDIELMKSLLTQLSK